MNKIYVPDLSGSVTPISAKVKFLLTAKVYQKVGQPRLYFGLCVMINRSALSLVYKNRLLAHFGLVQVQVEVMHGPQKQSAIILKSRQLPVASHIHCNLLHLIPVALYILMVSVVMVIALIYTYGTAVLILTYITTGDIRYIRRYH